MMSAGILDILLQFYMYGEIRHCEANEAFKHGAKLCLQKHGLIDWSDFPSMTGKGRAHVEALLNAPLPEHKWISPISPPDRS